MPLFRYTVTFEKPDTNPHYHIIIETDKLVNSVRNRITRHFQLTGSDRTVTVVKDTDKSLIYILKDGNIIFNNLLDDTRLKDLQAKTAKINSDKLAKINRRTTFRERCLQSYEPLDPIPELGDINGYFIQHNVSKIEKHIQAHITKTFRYEYQLIDRFIYNKFYYGIVNIYYTDYMETILSDWQNHNQKNF